MNVIKNKTNTSDLPASTNNLNVLSNKVARFLKVHRSYNNQMNFVNNIQYNDRR